MAKKTRSKCCSARTLVIFTPDEKRFLCGRTFLNCEFKNIDFSHANLRYSEFVNVSLEESDFSNADLHGARFVDCDLRGANFAGAALGRTSFDRSWLIGARGLSSRMSDYVRNNGALLWPS